VTSDAQHVLRGLEIVLDARQARIRRKSVVLIGFGLAMVYGDTELWEPIGTAATVVGMVLFGADAAWLV
jgi:hypothetical protein